MKGLEYAQKMSDSVMARWELFPLRWSYDYGVVFKGMEQVWKNTGDSRYLEYIKRNMDQFIQPDGSILDYELEKHNIDYINNGKLLFTLMQHFGEEKYKKAAALLRKQLNEQPRNLDGGFWHKDIYPRQMWLDGLYMGAPFLAEYGRENHAPTDMKEAAIQLQLMYKNALDAKTGLLFHAYDEARQQAWADKETGHSPHFWGRSIGWYCMALVDVMEILSPAHEDFALLSEILENVLTALEKVQDSASGCWYQILDMGGREGNYLESSCCCMFLYALKKARRMRITNPLLQTMEEKAQEGILKQFVREEDGLLSLLDTCEVAGLGGVPYRDGTYTYYISEPRRTNDLKGVGAFILAYSLE